MVSTADQIETHIYQTRDMLGSNIHELEEKVKSVTDWKHHFKNSPMTMIGIAFGGGVLLATMLSDGKRARSSPQERTTYTPRSGTDRQKQKALETWDHIKDALVGVAATRFTDFVGEVVPGFSEHFQRTQSEPAKSSSSLGAVS